MSTKVFSVLAIVAMMNIAHANCADDFKSCLEKCEANKYDIKACKGLREDKQYDATLEKCDLAAGRALGVCSDACKTKKEACEKPETKKESKS